MRSIWEKTVTLPRRDPLPGDRCADAVVIGGGLAGILTAYELQRRGAEVLVLEARRTGSGQTGRSTAKVTSQHGLVYHRLTLQLGEDAARQYAHANERAIGDYRRLIREKGIDCLWEECPAYLYSTGEEEPLRREAEAARRLGIDADLTRETELPFPVAAVRFGGQARFHPLRFLEGVAKDLTIYEDTPVRLVEEDRVLTDRGTVTAKAVVFACHYPFLNLPGYYFMWMHQERSYVLALEGPPRLEGYYRSVDQDGLSLRSSGEILLLGGGNHRTGEHSQGGSYEMLAKAAARYWPGCREAARWSAQDCMTLDGVPYIGRFSAAVPNWYVATGFGKWGMTSSMVSARILSGLVAGEEPEDAAVFSPQRFTLTASAKRLAEESAQAVKGLTRRLFLPPKADLDQLPRGHGGVVEAGGEKVGVYKDQEGRVFAVSVRCPHLGCQLEWNPDEKSWDCPCHGSRFSYRGELLDGPAQEDLDHG